MYFLFTTSSLEFYTHCILLSARLGISRRGAVQIGLADDVADFIVDTGSVSPLSEHLPRVWKTDTLMSTLVGEEVVAAFEGLQARLCSSLLAIRWP